MHRPGLLILLWLASAAVAGAPDLGSNLRTFFEQADDSVPVTIAGRQLQNPRVLIDFYTSRGHRPVWVDNGPLADQTEALLAAIRRSEAHGLNPGTYHLSVLARMVEGPARPLPLAYELLLSDAFMSQARDRADGAVSPRELDPEWELIASEADPAAALRKAMAPGGSVDQALEDLWPRHAEYQALVNERARILLSGDARFVGIPGGPLLRAGDRDERVALLKERLLGPGQHAVHFDTGLEDAVIGFQRAGGLEPDGIVGPATLEALNATPAARIDRIDANLERWRWLPKALPETHIRVNIAAFTLRVVEDGREVLAMDAIVGRPYRRTPIFSESIKYLVFNPYWNVPFRLAVEDKLPILKRDPAQLDALGYEVLPAGEEAFRDVLTVDWAGVTRARFSYLLRQRPGPLNALGRIKFMLPNRHDVYLHDTPERELFNRQERDFSSGCVRLSDPFELARWILEYDGRSEDAQRVSELASGDQTHTVYLRRPVPVYLVYFTAVGNPAAESVMFRRDIYQRDGAIVAGLRAQAQS